MKLLTASILLAATLFGCGENPPAKSADDEATRGPKKAVVENRKVDDSASKNLSVGSDVKQVCGIQEAKQAVLGQQPKFDFDSYDLTIDEKQVLDQVAECLTRGPLKGKNVTLVGHADSRGEPEYNMGLGAYRSAAVKTYLGGKGVEQTRMKETSRGALDATGTDEGGWHEDRRVDITLAN
jgi:peptidoglycan-associated lipoprotein